MRFLTLAGALGLALAATAQFTAPAQADGRYCGRERGGAENCGYYSFQQCLAAMSGNGGICSRATIQTQIIEVQTPRGVRRIVRDAID